MVRELASDLDEPKLAEGWATNPLTEAEARDLTSEAGVNTVWALDPDEDTRRDVLGDDAPADVVVDLVLETPTEYRLYSYTRRSGGTAWMDFGAIRKGTPEGQEMLEKLTEYRVLADERGGENYQAEG